MVKTVITQLLLLLQLIYYECTVILYPEQYAVNSKDNLDGRGLVVTPKQNVQDKHVVRCSRRFNPGNCEGRVRTVWTYNWQLQNCTERMGCSVGIRSNRFRSYFGCRRICQPLLDIYTRYLEERNHTDLRGGEKPSSDYEHFPAVSRSTVSDEDLEVDYQPEDREATGEDSEEVMAAHHGLGVIDVDRY